MVEQHGIRAPVELLHVAAQAVGAEDLSWRQMHNIERHFESLRESFNPLQVYGLACGIINKFVGENLGVADAEDFVIS
jgi:hypothetical protein